MEIETIKRAAALMREANGLLAKGPLDFYLTEMAAAYDLLMTSYAPFKVGQRVALARTPEITEDRAYGWLGSKHFLKKGAQGTVKTASCGSDGFTFGVEFDDESWIDRDGVKRPADQKHIYCFGTRSLMELPREWDTGTESTSEAAAR